MDCSICFDAIAATTGSATLSCGHQYHLGCIARWLMTNESCPYCRHAPTEHERVAQPSHDDEDSEDDMFDEDDRSSASASLDIPAFDDECHALWVLRQTFEMLERGESLAVAPVQTQEQTPAPLFEWHSSAQLEDVRRRQNQWDLYLGEDRGSESA